MSHCMLLQLSAGFAALPAGAGVFGGLGRVGQAQQQCRGQSSLLGWTCCSDALYFSLGGSRSGAIKDCLKQWRHSAIHANFPTPWDLRGELDCHKVLLSLVLKKTVSQRPAYSPTSAALHSRLSGCNWKHCAMRQLTAMRGIALRSCFAKTMAYPLTEPILLASVRGYGVFWGGVSISKQPALLGQNCLLELSCHDAWQCLDSADNLRQSIFLMLKGTSFHILHKKACLQKASFLVFLACERDNYRLLQAGGQAGRQNARTACKLFAPDSISLVCIAQVLEGVSTMSEPFLLPY